MYSILTATEIEVSELRMLMYQEPLGHPSLWTVFQAATRILFELYHWSATLQVFSIQLPAEKPLKNIMNI